MKFADLLIKKDRTAREDEQLHKMALKLHAGADTQNIQSIRMGGVTISPTIGMKLFTSDGRPAVHLQPDADVFMGADLREENETAFHFFANEQTHNGEIFGEGDIMLGQNASGVENILWDESASTIKLRSGTTDIFTWDGNSLDIIPTTTFYIQTTGSDLNLKAQGAGKDIVFWPAAGGYIRSTGHHHIGNAASGTIAEMWLLVMGSRTGSNTYGVQNRLYADDGQTVHMYNSWPTDVSGGGETVDAIYDFYVKEYSQADGTVTNRYGLYVESLTQAGTGNYAIYTNAGLVRLGDKTTIDHTYTAATGGEQILKITATDSVDQSSGMLQTLLVDHNITGAKSSTASSEGISVDMNLGANINTAYAFASYVSKSGNPNIDLVEGMNIYMEDMGGGTLSNLIGLDIGINSTNVASSRHAGLRIRNHSGTAKDAILIESTFGTGINLAGATTTQDIKLSDGSTLGDGATFQNPVIIDVTNTESLLVRKNSDGGDVFVVDTTNTTVAVGGATDTEFAFKVHDSTVLVHTSTEADDHTLEIDADAAGFGDVKALDIDYISGAIDDGQDEGVILINIDETLADGGDIFALEVLATDGDAGIYGLKAGALVGPIHQDSGTFDDPTTGTDNATPEADMIDGSILTTTDIFEADNEYIIIGAAAAFQELELIFTTASSKNIKPTFWYSINGGSGNFTQFTPVDGTDGCTHSGVIAWDASDLDSHVADDTTGTFDIKIVRTRNTIPGDKPVLGYAKVAITTEYIWDKDGNINVASATVIDAVTDTGAARSATLSILTVDTTANSNWSHRAFEFDAVYAGTDTLTMLLTSNYAIGGLMGVYGNVRLSAAGTVTVATGLAGQVLARAGTITHGMGIQLQAALTDTGTGTVVNAYGVFIKNPFGANLTLTNNYGIYVKDMTKGGTLNHAIFTNAGTVSLGDDLVFRQAATIGTAVGDFTVDGAGDFIIEDATIIDITSTEALLVRKNADGGDVLVVDTTNAKIGVNTSLPLHSADVIGDMAIRGDASDDEGIKLHTQYSNGNTSGRLLFAERNDDVYGFSLLYAGAANPTLGGTAFTLAANTFYIIGHNNSATGAVAMSIARNSGNVGVNEPAPDEILHIQGSFKIGDTVLTEANLIALLALL